MRMWQAGERVLGLYEVQGLVGQGGMGVVHRVRHLRWGVDLAVKSPLPHLLESQGIRDAFESECRSWIQLGLHPHVVSCFYVRRVEGLPRLFAEYVDGGSLAHWIRSGRLYRHPHGPLAGVLDVAVQTAWGLDHAHAKGVVHQDVKPPNVLLTGQGVAKITDFGLANALVGAAGVAGGDGLASAAGMTPAYASPEQTRRQRLSAASDIWSWALCVLEMFCGRPNWLLGQAGREALEDHVRQPPPNPSLPSMPEAVAGLLRRCLDPVPAERPRDLAEIAGGLAAIYADAAGEPYPRARPTGPIDAASSLNNRAVSLLDLDEEEQARTLWSKALELDPHHVESRYNDSLLRWRDGQLTDEEVLARVAAAHSYYGRRAELNLALLHLERRDLRSAGEALESIEHAGATPAVRGLRSQLQQNLARATWQGATLCRQAAPLRAVAALAAGRVAVGGDGLLGVWDPVTGHSAWAAGRLDCRGLAARADGSRLIAAVGGSLSAYDALGLMTPIYSGESGVLSVALDRAGGLLAAGDELGRVTLMAVRGGRVQHLRDHQGPVHQVAFAGDGLLVSVGADRVVRVWELLADGTARLRSRLHGHRGAVMGVAAGVEGRTAMTVGEDRTLRLWDLADGREVAACGGELGPLEAVCLLPGERHVATGGRDGKLRLWELPPGRCLRTMAGHAAAVTGLAVLADGSQLVSTSLDGTARTWPLDLRSEARAPFLLAGLVTGERAFSADRAAADALRLATEHADRGDWVGAAAALRRVRGSSAGARRADAFEAWRRCYPHLTRRELLGCWEQRRLPGHDGSVLDVCWLGLEDRCVSLGSDRRLLTWDLKSGTVAAGCAVRRPGQRLYGVSPHWAASLVGSPCGAFEMLELTSGRPVVALGDARTGAVSGDGHWAVVVGVGLTLAPRGLVLWELGAAGQAAPSQAGGAPRRAPNAVGLAVAPDGATAVLLEPHGSATWWDLRPRRRRSRIRLEGPPTTLVYRSLSADVVCLGADALGCWSLTTGQRRWRRRIANAASLALSADGRMAAVGHADGAVSLYEAESGEPAQSWRGHAATVTALAFDPRHGHLVTGSRDGDLALWCLDWELGAEPPALPGRGSGSP